MPSMDETNNQPQPVVKASIHRDVWLALLVEYTKGRKVVLVKLVFDNT